MDLPENSKVIRLENIPYFEDSEYDLFDEKDFAKFIKDVERRVRNSMEYKELMAYLKINGGMNNCAIFQNIHSGPKSKIKIEIHHSPFTLYEITMAVFGKRSYNNEVVTIDQVAKEVMYIHYYLVVGLIPLSSLAHDLTHLQLIDIHPSKVFGKWYEFKDLYWDFLLPETKEKLAAFDSLSIADIERKNKKILRFNPTYIQMKLDNALVDENGLLKPALVDDLTNTMDEVSDLQQRAIEEENKERERRLDSYNNIEPLYFDSEEFNIEVSTMDTSVFEFDFS